jgi:hypothetical protein
MPEDLPDERASKRSDERAPRELGRSTTSVPSSLSADSIDAHWELAETNDRGQLVAACAVGNFVFGYAVVFVCHKFANMLVGCALTLVLGLFILREWYRTVRRSKQAITRYQNLNASRENFSVPKTPASVHELAPACYAASLAQYLLLCILR